MPGETAESALLFLPSEAVYAELHATFSEIVECSYSQRVWVVSPTTLMATLNTVRAVLKDSRMPEQAGVIQQEVGRLDQRVENLERHFGQAEKDLREIRTSSEKIVRRGDRITEIELGEEVTKTLDSASSAQIHHLPQ